MLKKQDFSSFVRLLTLLFSALTGGTYAQDYALSFNGTSQYGQTANVVTTATDNVTMEMWVKWDGQSGNPGLIYNGHSAATGYGVYLDNPNLGILCGGAGYVTSRTALPTGAWHHIAAVRDNGTWKLYLDGVEKSLSNSSTAPYSPSGALNIASLSVGTQLFQGSIDEVRVWDAARTQAEIRANMMQEVSAQSNLIALYHMNEGSGTTINDGSWFGNNGTLYNTPTWVTGVFEALPAGTGVTDDEYQIASLRDLYWLSQHSGYWDDAYQQTTDIDASATSGWSSYGWSAIGGYSNNFSGSYDGQNHTITGMYGSTTGNTALALFGYTDNAVIQNLGVIDCSFSSNYTEPVGGLVGVCSNSTVSNCYTSGSISAYNYGGGLIGKSISFSDVSESYSTCAVDGGAGGLNGWAFGGLIGYNDNSTVNRCYSKGNVSNGNNVSGGLVGGSYSSSEINNCYSTGNVTGNENKGGLAGYCDNSGITNKSCNRLERQRKSVAACGWTWPERRGGQT